MARCPEGYAWDERLSVCVQMASGKWQGGKSDSHFGRNMLTFLIGLAFGFFSLWTFGWIVIVPFALLLGYLFFSGNKGVIYPIIGFIIGIVIAYWATIQGIFSFLTGRWW